MNLSVQTYGDFGNDEILFVHGLGQGRLSWAKQTSSSLTEHYRVVTFDLRGHGNSDKPDHAAAYASGEQWADAELPCFSGEPDKPAATLTNAKASAADGGRRGSILLAMQPDQEVLNRWSGSAPFWEKHREIIRQMFAPITQALVEDGQIGSQHAVLDIATGPGEPALSLAAVVGSEGKIFGIDPIPEMVAGARRAAERLGLQNTQFEVAGADQLPFPDDMFDAVISRFGVMFFPSPVEGVRELLRVLKPGRKIALAVWHSVESNPFFNSMSRVIDQHFDSPPLAPDAPDAFRFASRGKLLEVVREAGTAAPTERLVQCKIQAAISVEDFWTLRIEMSEKLREKIGSLSGERLAEVRRHAIESLSEYSRDGGMSFPAEVLIVSGAKGRPR